MVNPYDLLTTNLSFVLREHLNDAMHKACEFYVRDHLYTEIHTPLARQRDNFHYIHIALIHVLLKESDAHI